MRVHVILHGPFWSIPQKTNSRKDPSRKTRKFAGLENLVPIPYRDSPDPWLSSLTEVIVLNLNEEATFFKLVLSSKRKDVQICQRPSIENLITRNPTNVCWKIYKTKPNPSTINSHFHLHIKKGSISSFFQEPQVLVPQANKIYQVKINNGEKDPKLGTMKL